MQPIRFKILLKSKEEISHKSTFSVILMKQMHLQDIFGPISDLSSSRQLKILAVLIF
jgi:hypothetical protein